MADENKRLRTLDPSLKLDADTRRRLNQIFDAIDNDYKTLQTRVEDIENRLTAAGIP